MQYRFKPSNTFQAIQVKEDNLEDILTFVGQGEEITDEFEASYRKNRYLYLHLGDNDVIAPIGSWIVMFSPGNYEWMDAKQFQNDCEVVPL